MKDVGKIYSLLRKNYGRQGWWPVFDIENDISVYGAGAPGNESEMFEIAIGAILTQNVAWKNVEKALSALKKNGLLDPLKLHQTGNDIISGCIRPAGYYNQKAIKIKNFLEWLSKTGYLFTPLKRLKTETLRGILLQISGVGPETADSILLYAFERQIFVVDAYTKRIFSRLGFFEETAGYAYVQEFFHSEFPGTVKKYNEFHALIVAHGKDVCKKTPSCEKCCIESYCTSSSRKNVN